MDSIWPRPYCLTGSAHGMDIGKRGWRFQHLSAGNGRVRLHVSIYSSFIPAPPGLRVAGSLCSYHMTKPPSLNHIRSFSTRSQTRASKADRSGLFEKEILPVEIKKTDPTTGATSKVTVSKDDVIRFVPLGFLVYVRHIDRTSHSNDLGRSNRDAKAWNRIAYSPQDPLRIPSVGTIANHRRKRITKLGWCLCCTVNEA